MSRATVVCGDSHSLAIAAGGKLYAWGKAYAGRCGFLDVRGMPTDDDVPYQPIPRQVVGGGFKDQNVVAVASGCWHNLAVVEGGELYAWGAADAGRCGFADTSDMPRDEDNWPYQPVPRLVMGGARDGHQVVAIACSENHSLVVTSDGNLWAWGSLHMGRCGFADVSGLPMDDDNHPFAPVPRRVTGSALDGKRVVHVACGTFHSVAITEEGQLFSWGSACAGRCGFASLDGMPVDPEQIPYQPVPRHVVDGGLAEKHVVAASCSEGHSFAITTDWELFAWGNADAGRCGLPDLEGLPLDADGPYQPVPAQVKDGGLAGKRVKLVACGSWHSLAVTQDCELYAWGAVRAGRCGFDPQHIRALPVDENGPYQPVPRQVQDGGLRGKRVALVACGSWHSLAATEEGELFAWGVALMNRCGFDTSGMPIDDLCPYQPTPLAVVAMPKVRLHDPTAAPLRGSDAVCADLKELLEEESYADVCFEVGGEELRAHVAILAARCDYFRCMFRSGMSECRIDVGPAGVVGGAGSATDGALSTPVRRVQVADCGPVAFRQLLLWLYSGTVERNLPTEDLASLLKLSDLYRIPALRSECERLLSLHVDLDSTLALLQVAIATSATELEAACLKFCVEHVSNVRRHQSYDVCRDAEVMRKVATAWANALEVNPPSARTPKAASGS